MNVASFLNKLLASSFLLAGSASFAQTGTPSAELAASCSQVGAKVRVEITGTTASLTNNGDEYILNWKNSAGDGYYYTRLSTGQGYKVVPEIVGDQVQAVTVYFVSLASGDILVKTLSCTTTAGTVGAGMDDVLTQTDTPRSDIAASCSQAGAKVRVEITGTTASLTNNGDEYILNWKNSGSSGYYYTRLSTGQGYKVVPESVGDQVQAVAVYFVSLAHGDILVKTLSCTR